MKKGVVIVNTARGAIMDEDALVKALDAGTVWSCGLDVYEEEPKVHPGLVTNPHVMLVPHMGTWTYEVSSRSTRYPMLGDGSLDEPRRRKERNADDNP
jgi:lactate dehydrogenase-like 2-hydroxyacid dehydrogenase